MKRALLVDDDEQILHLMALVFRRHGWEVRTFEDASSVCNSALERCQRADGTSCADLLLTDLCMPGRSGLELVLELERKRCNIRHLAIMSGRWTAREKHEAHSLGYRVFDKPVRIAEISGWLGECERELERERVPAGGSSPA